MGFLVTDAAVEQKGIIEGWDHFTEGGFHFYIHPKQQVHRRGKMVLIGHAYDPFLMQSSEEEILQGFSMETLDRLTGVFTVFEVSDGIKIYGDATCMQSVFYGVIDHRCYISSHANLIGRLLDLKWDPYIKELIGYRFFHLFGMQLPGDLSEYREIKRLVPNHFVELKNGEAFVRRFHWPHSFPMSNEEIAEKVSAVMHNNMCLIAKKWEKPAISLTGGCDSKTTLACANGLYDQFDYFSYISSDEEETDAKAAHTICDALNLEHHIYRIPREDSNLEDLEVTRTVLDTNCGNMWPNNPNDVRKRAWFAERHLFDVEVKSWASEIGRAYYSKRFAGRKSFGKRPTPRKCSIMYKVFLTNRKLLKKTDRVFADYLSKYFEQAEDHPLPWQEQFFWEFRMAAWNGLVITHEQRYSYDITIPYNNRLLLEYLLSASPEDRINDTIYKNVREMMNAEIDATNISVQNVKHTQKRAVIENIYYMINTHLPF